MFSVLRKKLCFSRYQHENLFPIRAPELESDYKIDSLLGCSSNFKFLLQIIIDSNRNRFMVDTANRN